MISPPVFRLLGVLLFGLPALADNASFTNLVGQGDRAAKTGDVGAAVQFYTQAQHREPHNVADLCVLTEKYCDLMYQTVSATRRKSLLAQATACASAAVAADPNNATAHVCLSICYAKACNNGPVKTRVACSRLLKSEADTAIKLNPREPLAYYLLGRWNYGVANIGMFARGYVTVVYGGFPRASNEAAIKDFQKAIMLAPGHVIFYTGLANVYETTGQRDLAVATLKKCLKLEPLDRDDQEAREDALKKLNMLAR